MSDHGFRRVDGNIFCRIAKCEFDGFCLIQIIVMGTRSMRIDVIDLLRFHIRFLHCQLHCHTRALSVFCRRSDVICVACCAVSDKFCINMRASCLRMLQFLKNNHTGTFTEHESVSVLIKRAGRLHRITVEGESCQRCKSGNACRTDRRLRTACEHHIRIPVLDRTKRIADTMCT